MKKYSMPFISFMLIIFFLACKKDRDFPKPNDPDPIDTALARSFRLAFDDIRQDPTTFTGLTAIITIRNNQNQPVVEKKVVAIEYNQKFITVPITLAKGNYLVSGLLIKQGDTAVRFASPIAGSPKASLVVDALSVPIVLNDKTEKTFSIEVLAVGRTDQPQDFGYPAGSFGDLPGEQEPRSKRIFIRPIFTVGEIVYDSVPTRLVIRSWDQQNNMSYNSVSLPAGLQQIELPANGVRYELSVSKWGINGQINLTKEQVVENSIHVIGGTIAAKKLKTVFQNKIMNGVSKPLTKLSFDYHSNGEIKESLLLGKRADLSNYTISKDLYEYQNSRITQIRSYNENNTLIKNSVFGYNSEGRVSSIEQLEGSNKTNATLHYTLLPTSSGITQDHRVDINYTYSFAYYTAYYSKTMRGGSVLSDVYVTSHGNSEEGLYEYDFGINPWIHLGIPDLKLSNYAKHNKKGEWKTYQIAFPEHEVTGIAYTYDADGYPTEMRTQYRAYLNHNETFTIKTTFVY